MKGLYMTHDFKADRERLEAVLDARNEAHGVAAKKTVADRLFDCFKSADPVKQVEALIHLQNELAAKAAGVL
jgi:hypothetical protein